MFDSLCQSTGGYQRVATQLRACLGALRKEFAAYFFTSAKVGEKNRKLVTFVVAKTKWLPREPWNIFRI